MKLFVLSGFLAVFPLACAYGAELPATARAVTMEEFRQFADGKTVNVEIFDAGVPITAQLVWDWEQANITGDALLDGKTIKVDVPLSFKGDQACAQEGDKINCHAIYIDGNSFYEVTSEGRVHAISTLAD